MSESSEKFLEKYGETLVTVFSIGVFLILIGFIFARTPDLFDKVIEFFSDITITKIPNTEISFLAPSSPGAHVALYEVVANFSFNWGIFQIIILGLRFLIESPIGKKTEALTGIIFWLGVNYLILKFLKETAEVSTWFSFWTLIIALIGTTLIIRGIILLIQNYQK